MSHNNTFTTWWMQEAEGSVYPINNRTMKQWNNEASDILPLFSRNSRLMWLRSSYPPLWDFQSFTCSDTILQAEAFAAVGAPLIAPPIRPGLQVGFPLTHAVVVLPEMRCLLEPVVQI